MKKIKHLGLGITGGIAAYKAAELARLLVKQGISVQVVMTDAACQFITPITMQALSGRAVHTKMWDASIANGMPHIELSRKADAILVAPASADFMAKLVHGNADDLLSTLCLARDCPLLVAPAMNKQMWESSATQRNLTQLLKDGVMILGPDSGVQACGETGLGRMLEPEDLLAELLSSLNAELPARPLTGKRILITAGPTIEKIDPVRAITNLSSGKMGPTNLKAPDLAKVVTVESGAEMLNAVMANITNQDIFISVAAVADYRVASPSTEKIKKSNAALNIELVPNEDILAKVAALPNTPFCVGFAAESENLLAYAEEKRKRKHIPLIVANLVSEALGTDESTLTILDDQGAHPLPKSSKLKSAHALLMHIANML